MTAAEALTEALRQSGLSWETFDLDSSPGPLADFIYSDTTTDDSQEGN